MYFASYYRWLVIREWLQIDPRARVLDVGCDDGEIIAQAQAAQRVAVDNNPRSPDHAVQLVRADARKLPLATHSFDAVLAFDVIEHIKEDRVVLAELVRMLADSGTLWISTPAAGFALFPPFVTARANRGWGHVRNGYSLDEIKEKLPPDAEIEIVQWNEPVLRFFHIGLRVIDVFNRLTCWLAAGCFKIDRYLARGLNGHLFIRVRLDPSRQVISDL